ncbi:hypothetical protein ACFLQW_00940 [Candidatus Zixiibacteriota bacterium]
MKKCFLLGLCIGLAVALIPANNVNADSICDADDDRLCDDAVHLDCITSNGTAGKCVQRWGWCNCEATKGTKIILENCSQGVPNPGITHVSVGREVTFVLDGDCETLWIEGDLPIGNFLLTPDTAVNVLFEQIGSYDYTVEGGAGAGMIMVDPSIPTLTEWGMIIMFVIMAAGVVWFVVRNRRRMVTA